MFHNIQLAMLFVNVKMKNRYIAEIQYTITKSTFFRIKRNSKKRFCE